VELREGIGPRRGGLHEAGDLLRQGARLLAQLRQLGQIGAALDAMTSAPISLMDRRRMPGTVRMASSRTPSMTCQMSRWRAEESFRVIIMTAAFTAPML
jgi:hypothetical protein